jgi:hypothetical protein
MEEMMRLLAFFAIASLGFFATGTVANAQDTDKGMGGGSIGQGTMAKPMHKQMTKKQRMMMKKQEMMRHQQ